MSPAAGPDPQESLDPQEMASSISQEMVRIHKGSYGQGPRSAKTYVLDDVVLSVIDIELSPVEKALVDFGRHDLVREVRHGFQQAIDASFKAAVERATGRTVIGFVSDINIDPPFEIELFRLERRSGPRLPQDSELDE